MKGFLLKDLLLLKGYVRSYLLFLIVFGLISFKDPTFNLILILPTLSVMLCMSTFNFDEKYNWNTYAVTLPISKKNIVLSKYIFSIILLIVFSLIALLVSYVFSLINGSSFILTTELVNILGSIIGITLVLSIMIPFIYKFGSEKGRTIIFIIFILGGIGIGYVLKNINIMVDESLLNLFKNYGLYIILLIDIIVMFISYKISTKIFMKKEF